MAADNVKTAFCLPSKVNEDFIRNLIWEHRQQQQNQKISISSNKISTNSYQKVFPNIHRKRLALKSHFNKVSGLQPAALSKKKLRHRCFPVKLLRACFFVEHLRATTSGTAQDFTQKNGPNSNS